ncbi:MAG: hypothetical protein R2784_06920 [Saprospiraceae bacterium]
MFTLVFRAKADAEVNTLMNVSSEMTATEAYNANGDMMGVTLEFNGMESAADVACTERTKPFKGETQLDSICRKQTVTLSIGDATGKVVKGDYASGYNQVVVKRSENRTTTGVLSYQLTTGTGTAPQTQMIVVE